MNGRLEAGGWRRGVAGALILLTLGAGVASAADWEILTLRTSGKIHHRDLKDANGDGRPDVVAATGAEVILFLQDGSGRFRAEPDERWSFDPDALAFDVGAPGVLVLTESGIRRYPPMDGLVSVESEPFLPYRSILSGPRGEIVPHKDFLADLDGDGREDLILPGEYSFRIVPAGPEGFAEPFELATDVISSVSVGGPGLREPVASAFWYPKPFPIDLDGDGRRDLMLIHDDRIVVYRAGEDGLRGARAETFPAPFRSPAAKRRTRKEEAFDVTFPPVIADLDGDRKSDFVFTHIGEGAVGVYLGSAPGVPFSSPARLVKVKGYALPPAVADLNGDGAADLMLPKVPQIGILELLRIFLSRTVGCEVLTYLGKGGGVFSEAPDSATAISVPIGVARTPKGVRIGSSLLVSVDGDFDGDGVRDILMGTGGARVSFFGGARKGGIEPVPKGGWDVPAMEAYRFVTPTVADVNGDGRSDLLLHYNDWREEADLLVLIVSK